MSKINYFQKIVVITGGSSGIGFATACEFVKQYANVIIIGRDSKKLEQSKKLLEQIGRGKSEIMEFSADVTDKDAVKEVIGTIGEKFGKIDLLINCAGIITCGCFSDQPVEDIEKCLFTNYLGIVYTTKAAWPWLKKAKGQLSFVSSVAGYLGLIGYSSYSPTKFAIGGLAECLRTEGKDDNIRVSVIYPPDTDTPFLKYERAHTLPESIVLSQNIRIVSAEKVARLYVKALQKDKFEIYCDFNSRFVRGLKNNFPLLFHSLTERMIRKARQKQGLAAVKSV